MEKMEKMERMENMENMENMGMILEFRVNLYVVYLVRTFLRLHVRCHAGTQSLSDGKYEEWELKLLSR
jgi:hypothetical protein